MKALIVYYTKTGHTGQAARDITRGLELAGVKVDLRGGDLGVGFDLVEYQIVVVGSPTYGNRGYKRPAKEVQRFVDGLGPNALDGKVCGAFTVNAGAGGRLLIGAMEMSLAKHGGKVVSIGPVVKAGAPLSLWKGPDASSHDVEKCEQFGKKLAEVAAASSK